MHYHYDDVPIDVLDEVEVVVLQNDDVPIDVFDEVEVVVLQNRPYVVYHHYHYLLLPN